MKLILNNVTQEIAICQQFKKCGKAGCKCNAGTLHGPYYYYFYRINGKLKKSYISKANGAMLWEIYSKQRQVKSSVPQIERNSLH